jgi:hypothetical protein
MGKAGPVVAFIFRCIGIVLRHGGAKKLFHLHPGSGFCLLRMLALTAFLRLLLRQPVFVYLHTPYLERYLGSGFWRRVIGSLIRLSTRTIALTSYAKHLLEQQRLAGKVSVIPNPYRQENSDPSRPLKYPSLAR